MAVRLLGQDGREIDDVAVAPNGDIIFIRPSQPLAAGGYFLSYRVTSLDAHAVGATLRFGVDAPAPGDADPTARGQVIAQLSAACRWLVYVTVLGALGAALFVAAVRPPVSLQSAVHRLAARLTAAALVALTLRLGVTGPDLAGLPLRSLVTTQPWAIAAGTSLGPATALAGLGIAVIGSGRGLPGWMLAIGSAAVAGSFAMTGHAAFAEPRLLTGPTLALHALCAAFWLGSLLPLLWSLGLPPPAAASLLRRFSHVATAAVALLVVAGATLAWVQLDANVADLWQTEYGQRLLAKLALVAGLLILAAINRFALTPAVAMATFARFAGHASASSPTSP